MKPRDIHDEWLSLIEVSGPFLATPVLERVFSTGLPAVEQRIRQYLRQAHDEWCEARDNEDPRFAELHRAWIHEVLARGLEYDEDDSGELLRRGERLPDTVRVTLLEHGVTLAPDYALVSNDKPLLLVQSYLAGTDLTATMKIDGWVASPAERMERLCRASGCRLGLVTDGERWMLVDAPVGTVVTYASWYARLWSQERQTLQAFVALLGIARFFGPEEEALPALLDESLQHQEAVTDALGEQVRRAVEVLIQALDKEDRDRSRTLLQGVEPAELYEAGLTIMMRLVFLLSAEERGLLLMGDAVYESGYAISTLRMQLRQETEELLEHRHDAWARLLATFRAVYGGIEHETLRLPALGGSLFDPDRFPFLEGRAKGSDWKVDVARPLPIDNRTVLLLLEAIQQYQGRTLSYRALDVEQIGYVYEGLLERTVARTTRVTVELSAGKGAKKTLYGLDELEALHRRGDDTLADGLSDADAIKRSASAIRRDLERAVDAAEANRLLTACGGDEALRERALPFFHLLRTDPWGYPLVYPEGAFIVTTGSDRRETGTHYTPKSLTETIVTETLTPIVYVGPAEGLPYAEWTLKSPAELLDLKICDPAMGSGAFLVQACRWLAERLVEAWALAEDRGKTIDADGRVTDTGACQEPLPSDIEARTTIARRLIAERCLYGVDLNPLAVELAKLSIWLVTLAKGRPFGFLDHNLRCGDSLLGIHRLEQLTELSMTPGGKGQQRLFGKNIEEAVQEAIELRQRLREMPIRDIHDVEAMARLDADARRKLEVAENIANAFIGEVLASDGSTSALESGLASLAVQAGEAVDGDTESTQSIATRAGITLASDLSIERAARRPFHWPLEFPEVFMIGQPGFDAFVGNPPFLGNRLWKSSMGEKLQWQCQMILGTSPGKIDLSIVFHRRVVDLLCPNGCYGLLATSNISEGSAVAVGLGAIVQRGDIYFSRKGMPWPGTASVVVAVVCFFKGRWAASCDSEGHACKRIGARLEPEATDVWIPKELPDPLFSFEGVNNSKGMAFVLTADSPWFERLKNEPNSLLRPYITGDDITSYALRITDRWALDIADRTLEEIERNWPIAFQFLIQEVQSTRTPEALKSYKGLYERWWQFWNHRAGLMRKLREKKQFIGFAKATKYPFCMMAPSEWLYTNQVLLIEENRVDLFAICLSSFFRNWLYGFSVRSLGADTNTLRLSIREAVSTFALPNEMVSIAGRDHAAHFQDVLVAWSDENQCGLTDALNAVNTPSCNDPAVCELRQVLAAIDAEVALAYGWDDLDISYDFQEFSGGSARDSWRWALSKDVTTELMHRLTELNRQRFEELSLMPANARRPAKRGRRSKAASSVHLDDLFAGDNV
ncbi:Eco57I restriction-modification methylase domain-containing protein [Azotobacter chroococcum]|uniref:Eco57I restriction-modification methylase domain-containing protein n=1 Tax=Azotobacter chroococcum TaxID=353 RepID=UPI001939E87D|nr:type IIL restriction-modification enzyme MmeI [Azotobacter chroococcum]